MAERGVGTIPLLVPIVNLTALGRGLLPIHASAFVHAGLGVLVTGWAKGGKSEVLLAFAARGASYVGDEWVYLADDGSRMVGLPEPIRLWDWQLRAMPEFAARLTRGQRARLASTRALGVGARRRGRGTGRPFDRRRPDAPSRCARTWIGSSTSRSRRRGCSVAGSWPTAPRSTGSSSSRARR